MYKEFYQLTQNPFQLNANLDFFYNSAGHKRAKAYLRYGLVQGEGFVVVTGMPGTGKTMLVKELCKSLEQDKKIIIGLMVTSQVDASDTLKILLAVFEIPVLVEDSKAILLTKLQRFFTESARLGKRVLLIVDEAQNLPKQSIEELRMLTNFEWEGKVIFQIFLVGQEELGKLLFSADMEQVKQRIVATYHLKAIEKEEIKEYILFRLKTAGWNENPKFSNDVYTEIYNFTQGIPRRINTLCDRLLLYGYLEELSFFDIENLEYVINEIRNDYQSVRIKTRNGFSNGLIENGELNTSQDQRIDDLENKVEELAYSIEKERALLRKAILIQLDMDDIYHDK